MIFVSDHAYERAQQRIGWAGSKATLAALIGSYRATRVGVEMGGAFNVRLHREGMKAIMDGPCVITIVGLGR